MSLLSFLAGVSVGILCVFGALGLMCALIAAAWRDNVLRHLKGDDQ
jgi:hypothetical protein